MRWTATTGKNRTNTNVGERTNDQGNIDQKQKKRQEQRKGAESKKKERRGKQERRQSN